MTLHIRRARHGDADVLTGIAHAAKRHWGYPEQWLALWREALTFTPAFIAEHPVYVAVEDGRPVGCYALVPEGRIAVLEHLWVQPASMGRGAGRRLFEHALRIAAALGAAVLQIDSDPHTEAFYLRMGAGRAGERSASIAGVRRTLPRLVLPLRTEGPAGGSDAGRT